MEELWKHRMSIEYITIDLMIVNHLTKELTPKTFIDHIENMDIMSISEC